MKRQYLTPEMKVVNVQNAQIICTSGLQSTSSNESYDVVDEETTNSWFN